MKNQYISFIRFWEIIKVSFSLAWLLLIKNRGEKNASNRAVKLRKSLEKLGSVFIKLGQMLALRPDYIADEYCQELYKLLDKVPPFSQEQVASAIKNELKVEIPMIFDEFDFTPVASASFAQVHRARLKNGVKVAVKIQRPHIHSKVNSDITLLKRLARIIDFIVRPANKFTKIVTEFESWTKDELDYQKEADNIDKFNKFEMLIGEGIRGPKVFRKYSTSKILTMEFIEGYSLAQIIQAGRDKNTEILDNLTKWNFKGEEVINRLIRNTLEMTHLQGFFHADPHPANIIFNDKGELIFIDFGIVGSLTPKERLLILRYLRAQLSGDQVNAFNSLLALCLKYPEEILEKVKKEYATITSRLNETFDSETYLEQQKKSGPILIEALNLLQRNNFIVPVGIVRYFKAFETIEGLIFSLSPNLQVKNMEKEFKRISIISIVDALPTIFAEKSLNKILLKIITSIEDELLLSTENK